MDITKSLFSFVVRACAKLVAAISCGCGCGKARACGWLGCGSAHPVRHIIPTLQPAHFGRVYVAYGGIFIVLALLWEWRIDKTKPDTFDLAGALMALIGVSVMMYWPR